MLYFYSIDKNGCVSNLVNVNITGNQPITLANEPIAVNNIKAVWRQRWFN